MLAHKPTTPKASARPSPQPVVPAKRGRPVFEPTPMQRETVKVMVAGGIQQSAIAGVLRRPLIERICPHDRFR